MSYKNTEFFFSEDSQFDHQINSLLGKCYYGAADSGEVLTTLKRIPPANYEEWHKEWFAIAERVESIGQRCVASGNNVSGRRAFLRAATYFEQSANFIYGTKDPSRAIHCWKRQVLCWDKFCSLCKPQVQKVQIPYENISMPGYFFLPDSSDGPKKTVIFNNGSEGAISSLWAYGVAAALERGYAALVFDGPGQNEMLWEQHFPFRPDWEKVITPVIDYLLQRKDVDSQKIILSGISQGGYWILRALCFEHRIAAAIADPAVMDVSTVYFRELSSELKDMFAEQKEIEFNYAFEKGLRDSSAQLRQMLDFRMRPYHAASYYQLYSMVSLYTVREYLKNISCPVFIADPENEKFWPGQSKEVFNVLTCPKTIVWFNSTEGADGHCEPKARALYDQRVFDWLESVLA